MASAIVKGSFEKTTRFLKRAKSREFYKKLDFYGRKGIEALADATPKKTGKTSRSWSYEIKETDGSVEIVWFNSNVNDDWAVVALLIQYGHGLPQGGYVQGIDYINPAMEGIFSEIKDAVWKEVTK